MKKRNNIVKKIISIILIVFILCSTIPITALASIQDEVDTITHTNEIDVVVWKYGEHELHKTTINGITYPLFCVQYGKTSPSTSYKDGTWQVLSSAQQEVASFIFYAYYMINGNKIVDKDMAMTQAYVWNKLSNVVVDYDGWGFSAIDYNNFVNNANDRKNNWLIRPSFDATNIGNIIAGKSKTITDTKGVLKDYPAFSYSATDGVLITHNIGSNEIVINVDKNCTNTTFKFLDNKYLKVYSGLKYSEDNCCLFSAGALQALVYSAQADPVSLAFDGNIIPLGDIEITKQDSYSASVDGATFGLFTNPNCTNKIAETQSRNGKVRFENLEPNTYYIKELNVPSGYLIDESVITVKVESNNTSRDTIINKEPSGKITITKKLDTNKTNGRYGDVNIATAEYTLYAKKDIKSVAGTKTFFIKDEEVAKANIIASSDGKTGTITWDKGRGLDFLPIGEYYVMETKNPDGTFIDNNKYPVTLSYKNQNTKIIIDDATVSTDDVKSMRINIFKEGIDSKAGLTEGLSGAEFTIKLNADYIKALTQGYKYEEIWSVKRSDGKYYGIDLNGKIVEVNAQRSENANNIAPSYDVITSDNQGNALSCYLPYGKYIVKETKTPTNFTSGSDFSFSITQDEREIIEVARKVKHLTVNNTPLKAPVKIMKKDADSEKTVTLSSATFKIKATENVYDTATGNLIYPKGEYITYKVSSGNKYSEFITNSDGYVTALSGDKYASKNDDKGTVTTPFKLPFGYYEIVEITNPEGFLISENSVPFIISSTIDFDNDEDGDIVTSVVIKNEQPKGNIVINKSFYQRENIDKTLIENIDYTQISFELSAKEDIIDKSDGSIVYEKGKVIDTYPLDADGKLIINDLWIGDYTLKEVTTIAGAVLDSTEYSISFTVEDNTTKDYTETLNIENYTTEIDITKADITGEKEVEGAELIVFDSDGNVVDKWISTSESHNIEGLIVGKTYTLVEELSANGFVTASSIEFTVDNDKEIQSVTMYDKIVKVNKLDINGNIVKGAELIVTSNKTKNIIDKWVVGQHLIDLTDEEKDKLLSGNIVEGSFVDEDNIVTDYLITATEENDNYMLKTAKDCITSYFIIDINGNETCHLTNGLVEGEDYILTEISTPETFVTATSIEFNVSKLKDNQEVIMIDKQVEISKIDVTTGKELEGAKLIITDNEGNIVDEWVSTSTPHISTGLVENQRYVLTEVTAPYGFEIAESVEFTVTTDKETQKVVMKDDYIYSSVRVVKCDITTKNAIKSNDFEFSIYADEDCTELIETSSANKDEGTALFEELKYGTYYIAETKAPLGYSLSDQVVEIVINENGVFADGNSLDGTNGVYSFEYYDELLPVIKTGDTNSSKKLIVMCILLVLFVVIFIFVSKKIKKNNRKKNK